MKTNKMNVSPSSEVGLRYNFDAIPSEIQLRERSPSLSAPAPHTKKYCDFFSLCHVYLETSSCVVHSWKTRKRILECYILAIPFFSNTLISTIFYSYLAFAAINYIDNGFKFVMKR